MVCYQLCNISRNFCSDNDRSDERRLINCHLAWSHSKEKLFTRPDWNGCRSNCRCIRYWLCLRPFFKSSNLPLLSFPIIFYYNIWFGVHTSQQIRSCVCVCFVLFLGTTRRWSELLFKLHTRVLVRIKNYTFQCCKDYREFWSLPFLMPRIYY